MRRYIFFEIRCRVTKRDLMLLEQGVHLEAGFESKQAANLAFGERAVR